MDPGYDLNQFFCVLTVATPRMGCLFQERTNCKIYPEFELIRVVNRAGERIVIVWRFTSINSSSRNFASVRDNVSLMVPSSAAQFRFVIPSGTSTRSSDFLFGHRLSNQLSNQLSNRSLF